MRAEERDVVGQLRRHLAAALLGLDLQSVARLDLDVRDARAQRLAPARRGEGGELLPRRGAGGVRCHADAARRVGRARHPGGELVAAVAGEHQVGVAVHEPRDHAPPAGVEALVAGGAGRLHRGHEPVLEHERGVAHRAERALAELRIPGHEQADVVHHERGHPASASSARPRRPATRARRRARSSAHRSSRGARRPPPRRTRRTPRRARAPCRPGARCPATPWRGPRARPARSARRRPSRAPRTRPRSLPAAARPPGAGRGRPWPAARRARSRAPPRRGRRSRSSRCPRPAPAPPSRSSRPFPIPSARSRSVVGHRQQVAPAPPSRATSAAVTWVAWTAVKLPDSAPASASSAVGVRPCFSRHSSFSAGCSETCAWSGRSPAHSATTRADSGSTARTLWMAAPTRSSAPSRRSPTRSAHACASASRKPLDAAVQVTGVEQRDPQAGLGGGGDHRLPHRVAAGVEVVELADGRDARQRHLPEGGARDREARVGVMPSASSYICSRQVQNEPVPTWVRPRSARWNAWECALARPGQGQPGQALGLGRRLARLGHAPRSGPPPPRSARRPSARSPPSHASSHHRAVTSRCAPRAPARAPRTPRGGARRTAPRC